MAQRSFRGGLRARIRTAPMRGELLEPRWTPAWAGAPPTAITPPTNAVAATLNTQNDASGTASIATTEVDYYTFVAPVSGSYRLSATTPSSSLDSVLGIFSSTGSRLAYNDDISSSNRDSQLTATLTAGQRYYIGVTNYTGSAGGSYTWLIDGPAPSATDDTYEDNDSRTAASELGTLTAQKTVSNLIMADAADWYKFTMSGAGTSASYVQTNFTHTSGDLDLELVNSAGTRVALAQGTTNSERISLNGLAAGTYYVRVYGYQGVANPSYSLDILPGITVTPPTPTIDLAGSSLSVTNATQWGQTVTVQASTRNSGNTASGAFTTQWYLSQDGVVSADDILLSRANNAGTSYANASIAAGATSSFSVSLVMPSALPSGFTGTNFRLIMRTDAGGLITETNESNNSGELGVGLDQASITITVTPPASGFHIEVIVVGMTASQQQAFLTAAARWEQVIVGDLPNATYQGISVDDLLINASAVAIDGSGGVLGSAGPDSFRSGSRLPIHGTMRFDTADLANMENNGTLVGVIMHEMGHVLGIGTLWSSLGLVSGTSGDDPRFTGAQAVAAYNAIYGTTATGVPVENTGGSGTRNSHWRESIFGSELMTGWASGGMQLSRVTAASLADMGYQVNMAAASNFVPTSGGLSTARTANSTAAALVAATDETDSVPAEEGTSCTGVTGIFTGGRSSRTESAREETATACAVDAVMSALAELEDAFASLQPGRRLRLA